MEITWGNLKFDCAPVWNPNKHCYEGLESNKNPITVTNTTQNSEPIRVTLTFVPKNEMGATAVFAPCDGDPNPDDFTFSNGQVTFLLPRNTDSKSQATVNLFLTGDPMGQDTQQYNQIGSIKTEFAPLNGGTKTLEIVPPPISEIQPSPVSGLPLSEQAPPIIEKSAEENPPIIEKSAEENPSEIVAEKAVPENTAADIPSPEQNLKEETQTAPHTEWGAPPQEEPL